MARDDSKEFAHDAKGGINALSFAISRLMSEHRPDEARLLELSLVGLRTASNYLGDFIEMREARHG